MTTVRLWGIPFLKLKMQLLCGDEIVMGSGKADLLDSTQRHSSISTAGLALGISYIGK